MHQVDDQVRSCGECTACCEGHLAGNVYGHVFKPGTPCFFLLPADGCGIYPTRPASCRKYKCAWLQGLLPDWLKPTKSGVLVSVEVDHQKKQFLKVVIIKDVVDNKVFEFLDDWVVRHDTYYIRVVPK
jgi:hypothetical protein